MSEEQNAGGLPQLEETSYTPKQRETSLAGIAAPILEETTYTATEKRVHLADVQAPTLADDTYVAPVKNSALDCVQAPALEETVYTAPKKNSALDGVAAPVLADTDAVSRPAPAPTPAPTPAPELKPLTDEMLAVLQQRRADAGQPPYTEEQIASIREAYLERQRQAIAAAAPAPQQAAPVAQPVPVAPQAVPPVAAPVLEEPAAPPVQQAPKHPEPPKVDASALLEEPAPEPARPVSRFNEADLEAAKANAKKRAIESALKTEAPVDKAESRRLMQELRMQREADLAKKGFSVVIMLVVIGLLACGGIFYFFNSKYENEEDLSSFLTIVKEGSVYVAAVLALLSALLIARIEVLKKLATGLFGLTTFLLIIPGVFMVAQKAESVMTRSIVAYVAAILCSGFVCFTLSTNEAVNMYFKHREAYDYDGE